VGQKVVLWFSEGQKHPICPVPETVLQIKHWTTEVVLSCPSFFSKSNAPKSLSQFFFTQNPIKHV